MALVEGSIGYRRLFEQTRARLEARRISVHLEFGPHVAPTDFETLERESGLSIPASLRQFYLETGNGLTFRWFLNRDVPSQPGCWLVVPPLYGLQQPIEYLRMLNESLAGHVFCGEPPRRQYQRQLTFFPFLEDNADLLCIEPKGHCEVVVFHDHEWSFYPSGDSGIQLAESLAQFWWGWSRVGFVQPKQWWPSTAANGGTVWSEEHFGFSLGVVESGE